MAQKAERENENHIKTNNENNDVGWNVIVKKKSNEETCAFHGSYGTQQHRLSTAVIKLRFRRFSSATFNCRFGYKLEFK